jgi:hypothetical protein
MQQMAARPKATRPYPAGRCHALVREDWTMRAIPASRPRGNSSHEPETGRSRAALPGSNRPAPQN